MRCLSFCLAVDEINEEILAKWFVSFAFYNGYQSLINPNFKTLILISD